jgi:hypothetical protein
MLLPSMAPNALMAGILRIVMPDVAVARNRFTEFQAVMNQWETKYFPLIQENWERYAAQAKRDLKVIFDEYVYGYRPDEGRMAGPDVGSPPDHDPQRDLIEKIEAGRSKVTIYVQKRTQFEDRFRHVLGEHDGRWMIEKSEILWDDKGKWGKYLL